MNNHLPLWSFISFSIEKGRRTILLYVLESRGSSPGRQGFGMAVNDEGSMVGSIGGGIMEHKFVEMAKEMLRAPHNPAHIKKQVHDKSASRDRSGMICSGEQTVLLYEVNEDDTKAINSLIKSLQANSNGALELSPRGIHFHEEELPADFEYQYESGKEWVYREKTGCRHFVYIIGGGHCSLALSQLMRSLDFYVIVIEERTNLNTLQANEAAHEKILVSSYEELNTIIPEGNERYVVIMTFGYRTDDVALRSIINKKFRYLGVLGSAAKMQELFSAYRAAGMSEEQLARICTPVGLPIRSQTPWEIAVSIAAQVIKIKNQP